MRIQRLPWAGLRLEADQQLILIDAVEDFAASLMGEAAGQVSAGPNLAAADTGRADYVLLTHLHRDHYDPALIRRCLKPGGLLFCPDAVAEQLRHDGLERVVGFAFNQEFRAGRLTFAAVYALDGFGDPQCAWVVDDGQQRILHGGDTLWHSHFWSLGSRYQSFDAVFLPINGVVVHMPDRLFSPVPATLTPQQAVSAAQLLGARQLVPIHFGLHLPGFYEEHPDALGETTRLAAESRVGLAVLQSGQELVWP